MFEQNFYRLTRLVLSQVGISVFLLFSFRLLFLSQIVTLADLTVYSNDLFKMAVVGIRFDLKVTCIAFSIVLLVGLALAKFKQSFETFFKLSTWFSYVIYFVITCLSIVNFYYYQTYGNYIDVFIFGLFDDDTKAIFDSVWSDYPVVLGICFTIIITWIFAAITKKFNSHKKVARKPRNPYLVSVFVVLIVVGCFILARGSIGTFPLKRYHANVSDHLKINAVTPNVFMALDWARTDYAKQFNFTSVDINELNVSIQKIMASGSIQQKTPVNTFLLNNKPNVVVALMESMGTSIIDEDIAETNDVLGSFRLHITEDFLFKRFYAETSATSNTLMGLLVQSIVPTISHSSAAKAKISGSAVIPYNSAGYETIFIIAGNGMWRNLYHYLPAQGFDKIYDENSISAAFPDAAKYADTWGVPDEFVFKFTEKIIAESDKPVFIFLLTVTNHSPYRVPDNYHPKPVKVSDKLKNTNELSESQQFNMLQTYQYSSDALGEFITNIKSNALISNTIVAATGDHRLRSMQMKSDADLASKSQVPLYLYVPENILNNIDYKFDAKRVGSHKDLFPTLYHLSLSDASYSSLGGNDLLSVKETIFWGYSEEGLIYNEGVILKNNPGKVINWENDSHHFDSTYSDNDNLSYTQIDVETLRYLYINYEVTSQ